MNRRSGRNPCCIIIAGPNGAGETTFAREFLPEAVTPRLERLLRSL